jgi:hypothetical protein
MYHPHFTSFILPFVAKSGNFSAIWEKSGIFGCLLPFWLLYGCFK